MFKYLVRLKGETHFVAGFMYDFHARQWVSDRAEHSYEVVDAVTHVVIPLHAL